MNQKTFSLIASVIFLLIGLLHALRLALGWDAVVNTWAVPMWVSWVALVITLYLASEGFRLLTIRNTAAYDIIVATADGKKHANIQVKTSQKKFSFWPMPSSDRVCTKPNDYYVFLRWLRNENKFEGFMLKGTEARTAVATGERRKWNKGRRLAGKPMLSSLHVNNEGARYAKRRKQRWDTWNAL